MLRRYVTFVVGRPKLVIALTLAITLVLGAFIGRLRVLLDVDDQIPPRHPMVVVGKRIEKLFGGKFVTVVGFYPKTGTVYTPATLAKLKRVTSAVERLPGIKSGSVLSLMSSRVKDIQSGQESLEIQPLAEAVPQTDAEMAAFRERVKRNSLLTSLLVSDDGRATAVIADFEDFKRAGGAAGVFPALERILEPERRTRSSCLTCRPPRS